MKAHSKFCRLVVSPNPITVAMYPLSVFHCRFLTLQWISIDLSFKISNKHVATIIWNWPWMVTGSLRGRNVRRPFSLNLWLGICLSFTTICWVRRYSWIFWVEHDWYSFSVMILKIDWSGSAIKSGFPSTQSSLMALLRSIRVWSNFRSFHSSVSGEFKKQSSHEWQTYMHACCYLKLFPSALNITNGDGPSSLGTDRPTSRVIVLRSV